MRPQDLEIGKTYRLRSSPNYGYVKVLRILNGKELPNTHTYKVAECEHTVGKNDSIGITRYFRPVDLEKQHN